MIIKRYKRGWPCKDVSDDKRKRVSHYDELNRLSRVIGQLNGVKRMISSRERSCRMIIQQLLSASAALLAIAGYILERHENHCLNPEQFPSDRENLEYQKKKAENLKKVVRFPQRKPDFENT